MTGQNFTHMQILMASSRAPQMPLFMINRIVRRKGGKAMKTTGKSQNKYTRKIIRVYDVCDFSGRVAGTEEPSCTILWPQRKFQWMSLTHCFTIPLRNGVSAGIWSRSREYLPCRREILYEKWYEKRWRGWQAEVWMVRVILPIVNSPCVIDSVSLTERHFFFHCSEQQNPTTFSVLRKKKIADSGGSVHSKRQKLQGILGSPTT